MKRFAFIIYTIFCIALGSVLFQTTIYAAQYLRTQYWEAYELGAPAGYRACAGMSFKEDVTKKDVLIEWKSDTNFVVYIEN